MHENKFCAKGLKQKVKIIKVKIIERLLIPGLRQDRHFDLFNCRAFAF